MKVTGDGVHDTTTKFQLKDASGALVDSGETAGEIDFTMMSNTDLDGISNALYVFEGEYPTDTGYTCTAEVVVATGVDAVATEEDDATPTLDQVGLRTGVESALSEAVEAQFEDDGYAECGETPMSLAAGSEFTCWLKSPNGAGIRIAVEVTDANGGPWWGSMSGNGVNGTARVPMDGSVSLVPYEPIVTERPTPVDPVSMGNCTVTPYEVQVDWGSTEIGLDMSADVESVNSSGTQDVLFVFELVDVNEGGVSDGDAFVYKADLDAWAADIDAIPTQVGRVKRDGMDPDQYTCQATAEGAAGTGYLRKFDEDMTQADMSAWPRYAYEGSADYDICQSYFPFDNETGTVTAGIEPKANTPEWSTISSIQAALRSLNYGNPDPLPVTGTFGPMTEKAVKSFQERRGLPVTGDVDYMTWDVLRERMRTLGRCAPQE